MSYDITIKKKDGTVLNFHHLDRKDGTIRYEGAFAIVTNLYGEQTIIPAADIAIIQTYPVR